MAKPISKEKGLYRQYAAKVNELLNDEEAQYIFDSLSAGRNSYMRMDRVESSAFDLSWITMIEQAIPDLGTIINNPRLNTKTVSDLVPVELARKTNADSVKHLASHTQFIKEIKDNGDVIPNKILNIGADDEIKTYENRFVATVIRHLVLFIEKRYEFVKNFAILHDHETLYFKNRSTIHESEVEIETKVKVISKKMDPVSLANNEYIKRIEQMRQYILYFYNSRFMKAFKTERDVRNPILQTNIIRKNPLYHHAYELYRFVEAYDRLGVSYKVDEHYTIFDNQELREMNSLMFANYLSLQGKEKAKTIKTRNHEYKPKILTSSDDEQFVFGPLLKGPIQFVRVDEPYQRYLDSKLAKDLPSEESLKKNEHLKNYYSQELDVRKLTQDEYDEKMKLLVRKGYQKVLFDKDVLAKIKQREEEEERERQRRIEARLKEEEEYLAKFRQRIVDEALAFRPELNYVTKDRVNSQNRTTYVDGREENHNIGTFYDNHGPEKTLQENQSNEDLERELAMQEMRLKNKNEEVFLGSSLEKEDDLEREINPPKKIEDIASPLETVPPISQPAISAPSAVSSVTQPQAEEPHEDAISMIVPLAPDNQNDMLTAGLEESEDNKEIPEVPSPAPVMDERVESDEEDSREFTTSENQDKVHLEDEGKRHDVPVPLPFDMDDPNRLTSDERKAVLTYGLDSLTGEDEEEDSDLLPNYGRGRMPSGIFGDPSKGDLNVPFDDADYDYYLDPFARIRALNKAYKEYDKAHGPYVTYPGLKLHELTDDLEDSTSFEKFDKESLTSGLMDEPQPIYPIELEGSEAYVIHTKYGYFVSEKKFSDDITQAYVYKNYDTANMKAMIIHGRVIKK